MSRIATLLTPAGLRADLRTRSITISAPQTPASFSSEERARPGVTDSVSWYSVGIEESADRIDHLAAALE